MKNRMSEFLRELSEKNDTSEMMKVIRLLEETCNRLISESASLRKEICDYKRMLNLPPDNQSYSN
jgi:hypothetical protein